MINIKIEEESRFMQKKKNIYIFWYIFFFDLRQLSADKEQ
jgi:hypothetical protein